MEQLLAVSQDQDINFLYSLIRQDPEFFHAFDQKQFADTPLHFAAGEGRTALSLEIQRLMPSFGKKLNPDGFSPLDLAMRRGHTDTVSAMVKLNWELVRVQGREGFTLLHYAAEIDDVNNLAIFLDCCPESIEDLTIHGESALHVAVKNGKFAAFRVLFGWLKRTDRTKVLSWGDLKGNNVLHLAASTNQPKIMELLIKDIPTHRMNSKGLTALDMIMELPPEVNGKALQILQRNGAKRGSILNSHPQMVSSLATYLSSPITILEKIFKFEVYLDIGLPVEMRNAILVVAVLIVTAMYQAVLSPPGGFNDQTPNISNSSSIITNITSNIGHDRGNGTVVVSMTKGDFLSFTLLNSVALGASVVMIFLVLPSRLYNFFLYVSLLFLTMSYFEAMSIISPPERRTYVDIVTIALFIILYLIIVVKGLLLPGQSYVRATREVKGYYFFRRHEAITQLLHNKYSCINSHGKR